ncbi:COX aromatic rich motif-containing protein, partial [Salmonella enterica subsp. enterica serovar Montevideo]|nr:COX aromatic rich motif-containing protein [Salmonella enterica subsp. enterica serovar Montevideo]
AKQSPNTMNDMAAFEKVAMPSEYNKVEYFSSVKPDLFKDVINMFSPVSSSCSPSSANPSMFLEMYLAM